MKVKLINADEIQKELELAGWMASVSYDSKTAPEKIAKHCIKAGHSTPTRAMRFLFEISEVSRAFSHEFVRHEIGVGKVQRSQRYVNEDGFACVIPGSLVGRSISITIPGTNYTFNCDFNEFQSIVRQMYKGYMEQGCKAEDARYVLTNATQTKINVCFDWEGLQNFFYRRGCNRAQWEIRFVANLIKDEVTKVSEFLGSRLMTHCERYGFCNDSPSCGKAPTREKFFETYEKGKLRDNFFDAPVHEVEEFYKDE